MSPKEDLQEELASEKAIPHKIRNELKREFLKVERQGEAKNDRD